MTQNTNATQTVTIVLAAQLNLNAAIESILDTVADNEYDPYGNATVTKTSEQTAMIILHADPMNPREIADALNLMLDDDAACLVVVA